MSQGKEKFVSVAERELRRLREQESRLRSVQQDLPDRLNCIREESRKEMQQRLIPLEKRAKQQEQESQSLRSNLAELERNTQKRLQQQRQEFQQAVRDSEAKQKAIMARESERLESAMRSGLEKQRGEYLRITTQQRQEYLTLNQQLDWKFDQLIAEERQAREAGQQILQKQIEQIFQNIEQERQYKAKLAQDFLDDIGQIWEQIDRDYQHQRFAPHKLVDLRRNLELAKQNLAAGAAEAAIATSQETYLKLADLRLELEQKEQESLIYYNSTLEDLRALLAEARAHRQVDIELGEAGSEVEIFREEVDYWTNGQLTAYEQQLQILEQQLQDGEKNLTTEQIKQIADRITTLEPELGQILEQAKLQVILSQMRAEIAHKVVELLENYGYQIADPNSDAGYEGTDYRNAYVVKAKNIAGDEVVTVISPEQEFGANNVSINAFSERLQDDTQLKERAESIFNALHDEAGLELKGETKCYVQPRAEYQDIKQVKQRRVQQAQSSQQSRQT